MTSEKEPLGELIDADEAAADKDTKPKKEAEPEKTVLEDKRSSASAKNGSGSFLKRSMVLLLVVALLLPSILAGYGFYWLWQKTEAEKLTHLDQNSSVSSALSSTQQQFNELNKRLAQLDKKYQTSQAANQQVTGELLDLKERIAHQKKRLLAMSTTSREDWLLAEAAYLLRLANQRVLIERRSDNAIALLQEADAILREFNDPDLFELRAAIGEDLVALKLAKKVDVEGVYIELRALAHNIINLPLVPESYEFEASPNAENTLSTEDSGIEQKLESSFSNFLGSLKNYVRIIDHEDQPKALLPADSTAYLQLNLRLLIEQAQLALLREQTDVYKSSLSEARNWVEQYFPYSPERDQYREALTRLLKLNVKQELPNISRSLKMLNSYIAELHGLAELKINGQNQAQSPQAEAELIQPPTEAAVPFQPKTGPNSALTSKPEAEKAL
ncbi:uroporphyrinogen-III C-methyltransferase [Agaribacterium sp. ZY112]|uniref:uroporphyrinogen-III C-methyltransferase n=1 Tax=Agaribacterium sp. ZY112 TaxID=3233574 RepID=UPI0035238D43